MEKDELTFRHFPQLSPNSQSFDKEFYAAVKSEIDRRAKNGRSYKDPDLLLDSASFVAATNSKFRKSILERAQEQNRMLNNKESSFHVEGQKKQDSSTLNERQFALAERLNLSRDRLKELHKKYQSNHKLSLTRA